MRDTATGWANADSGVRLAEVMGPLSLATDAAMGQPLEFALGACVLAMRLGEAAGYDDHTLRTAYDEAFLRYIGCNAETPLMAALVGDELALRHQYVGMDTANTPQIVRLMVQTLRGAYQGGSPLQLARAVVRGLLEMPHATREIFAGHCEVAQRLAERLGCDAAVIVALGQLYERWDGRGLPGGLKGEAVAPAVRLVSLAQDVVAHVALGGPEAAIAMARERRGRAYDPHLVDCFVAQAPSFLGDLERASSWDVVLALEPRPWRRLTNVALDAACEAMANFVDIKSSHTLRHSPGVAALAAGAAARLGLPPAEVATVERAGWLHDLGHVAVSSATWERPVPFTQRDWEAVRLHPYYTERILARPEPLRHIGAVASLHHERIDGQGYHRAAPASLLTPAARVLAAADVFQALQESRPHRLALAADAAVTVLRQEVRAGHLDGEAVEAVLAAGGQTPRRATHDLVGGLSAREVEVLGLIARGLTIRQIAARLVVAPKTADNHIQHIYAKIGVSTRAGATLFAIEHGIPATD